MIKLEIAKYCEDCPEFEADVEKVECDLYADIVSFPDNDTYKRHDTIIRCKHAERCASIRKHLLRSFDI